MNIIVGRGSEDNNCRVVAMQCMEDGDGNKDKNSIVYKDSIARIPDKVSDMDAISTYITSLSTIYCALPKIDNIGGALGESITTGKSVVLGSSDIACFAAEGLASLGIDVTIVNNKGSASINKFVGKST
jgi:hypothetical protein